VEEPGTVVEPLFEREAAIQAQAGRTQMQQNRIGTQLTSIHTNSNASSQNVTVGQCCFEFDIAEL
jgi:hypothetical protein